MRDKNLKQKADGKMSTVMTLATPDLVITAPQTISDKTTLEELVQYALERHSVIEGFARRTVTEVWHLGHALRLAQIKIPANVSWTQWVKDNLPFSITTANQAIGIYKEFRSPEEVDGMTVTQAKMVAGLISPKKVKEKGDEKSTGKGGEKGTKPAKAPTTRALIEMATLLEAIMHGELAAPADDDFKGSLELLGNAAFALREKLG